MATHPRRIAKDSEEPPQRHQIIPVVLEDANDVGGIPVLDEGVIGMGNQEPVQIIPPPETAHMALQGLEPAVGKNIAPNGTGFVKEIDMGLRLGWCEAMIPTAIAKERQIEGLPVEGDPSPLGAVPAEEGADHVPLFGIIPGQILNEAGSPRPPGLEDTDHEDGAADKAQGLEI
jgi:hypothetical protein